ncbi:hypothetical protein Ocin01_09111 [Orchesella cincta]|uniref:IgA Peptidase M64 n=1 Tax=Orchesella cincta TaxID=48709 RepID=A0A1D2MWZ9_ORCCI|nr:hypothetical protein Ocin01_09111 [Orchesella cincta]
MTAEIMKTLILLCALVAQIYGQAHHIKFRQSPEENHSCIILENDFIPQYRGFETDDENEFKFSSKPAIKTPADTMLELKSDAKIVEVFAKTEKSASALLQSMCKSQKNVPAWNSVEDGVITADPEIRKIVDGGDQRNRIDVVFMGDGYTASEKELFFDDMQRLTTEMFNGITFRSYLPVFNIWAIYVESEESGIGYDGPKNTPFELYRESGQLRGIFPGNSARARQVCALTGASGCDYPSIIGNDDFYGGLGGEFVISTKSARTGTVVLRHEMGHNFVDVGEEYDNGQVYSGVNAARNLANLGWTSWLTTGTKREERAMFRLLQYPWADLSKGPQSFNFLSDGNYDRWYMLVSVSAAGEADSLEFLLDGEVLPWTTTGFDDREFYSWSGTQGFRAGAHNFTVRSKTASTHPDIPRMICSITLHEFGNEDEFVADNTHVSAYPTWDVWRLKSLRPTNAGCLMRNMTHAQFCPVCQEGMWAQFLERVSLIDNVTVADSSSNGLREVTVNTLKLGQLRAPGNEVPGETLEVKWILNNSEQEELRDQFTINAAPGSWACQVHFNTTEVRNDPQNLLTSTQTFTVPPV